MLTITHLLVGAISVGMGLQTTDPTPLLIGAVGSLLPDIDISTSPAGRVLPFISKRLEKRFAHRSATHSLIASGLLAAFSYGLYLVANPYFPFPIPLTLLHALNIGYFAGWFLDCFTKSGVEMFYPSTLRCVCPGNRNLRIATGSPAEYWLIVFIVAIALWTFQLNSAGGFVQQFNSFIAVPSGTLELYNKEGGSYLILAEYEGVRNGDRTPVKEKSPIVAANGEGFLVDRDGEVVKVGPELDSTIIAERIRGEKGKPALTTTETIYLEDEGIEKLRSYDQPQTYVSGQIAVDSPEDLRLAQTAQEFKTVVQAGGFLTFYSAPIAEVVEVLQDQYLTGSLTIKQIKLR